MEGEVVLALVTVGLIALVVLGAWLYMLLSRGTISGAGAAFVTWLVVTAATLGAGFMVAFPGIHMLLFLFGIEAGWIGIVLGVALAVAVPVVWAVIIRRKMHHGTPGLPVGS